MAAKSQTKPKGESKPKATPRPQLPENQEKRLAAVADAFPENKAAVNFGRKLLKIEAGLRTTPAPRGELTDEQVDRIHEILGVERKKRAAKSEETEGDAAE